MQYSRRLPMARADEYADDVNRRLGLAIVAWTLACGPVNEGPQLELVPDRLGYLSDVQSFGSMLPGMTLVRQIAYWVFD